MSNLNYKVKVSNLITTDKGTDKVQNETWVVNATTVIDAATKAHQFAESQKLVEFNLLGINISSFKELHTDGSTENNYNVVINWVMLDEEKGIEKKQKYAILIEAENIADARVKLQTIQQGTVTNWEEFKIEQTNISQVIQ